IPNVFSMENISIFDMLKIGVGPSSSHTLGPWRAAQRWIGELKDSNHFDLIKEVYVELYGSLSLTGKGHATDFASILGLSGYDPVTIPITSISSEIDFVKANQKLVLNSEKAIPFIAEKHIVFNKTFLPFHPNGITFKAVLKSGKEIASTVYSIGGGFVVKEERKNAKEQLEAFSQFPFPTQKGIELLAYCKNENKKISEIVLENERTLRNDSEIDRDIQAIWNVMLDSMYTGCHTEGTLPGGL